jgi:hypothetical protein
MARIAFEGEPATLVNQAAGMAGSIHDDERARELGFRRGFIPGTTISLLVEDAIVRFFGKTWFEGGWHDMKFIAAAYDDEPVRVVLTEDGGPGYALAVLTPDDRLTCQFARNRRPSDALNVSPLAGWLQSPGERSAEPLRSAARSRRAHPRRGPIRRGA